MKAAVLAATLLLVPGTLRVQATGGTEVAVIDLERAMVSSPEGKKALDQLTTLYNEQSAAIQKKQKEADDLETRLKTQDRALSADTRTKLIRDLDTARTAVTRMSEDAQGKIDELKATVLSPVEDRTRKVVRDYAAERSFSIVLDSSNPQIASGLIFVRDTADITTEIIRRLTSDATKTAPDKDASLFVPGKYERSMDELIQSQMMKRTFGFASNLQ